MKNSRKTESKMPTLSKKLIGGVAAGILGVSLLFGSFGTVSEGFVGIKRTNGAAVSTLEPGLYFKLPFFQDVVDIETRSKVVNWDKMETYSKDQQPVKLHISIQVSTLPGDALNLYKQYGTSIYEKTVYPVAEKSIKDVFGGYSAADIVQHRAKLGADLYAAVKQNVEGVRVEAINLQNVDFSDAYEKSIEERMLEEVGVAKSAQTVQKEQNINTVSVNRAKAAQEIARANTDAVSYDIRQKGEAEAAAIEARGKAVAGNPLLIELMKVEKWNGALPTTMPPNSAVPFVNVK